MSATGALRRTYERFGQLLYAANWKAEARLRGLATGVVTVEGLPLSYFDGGDREAEAVVLLHGFTADKRIWIRFAGRLLNSYRVLIPDLPGHGQTPFRPGLGYSPPDQARRVVAMLDALGIPTAHVYGNSMGGFIAAHLGLGHAGRIASIGLSDAAGVDGRAPSRLDRLVAAGDNPFLLDSPAGFSRLYPMTMHRPPFNPAPARAGLARDYIDRKQSYAEIFADFHGFEPLGESDLAGLAAPTLVVWGARDELVDVSAAHLLHRRIPGAELNIYEDLGHMPMLEAPGQAAEDYLEFLSRNRRQGRGRA